MRPASPLPTEPSIAHRDVWFFAAVPWDFPLAGRTRHLALGLKALGARVTFAEFLDPSSLKRALLRPRGPQGDPEVRVVRMPPSIPKLTDHLPALPRALDAVSRLWLRRALAGARPLAVVSNPRWVPILEGLDLGPVFYDCIDDLKVHAPASLFERYARWERALIARCAGCFAVTPALARTLGELGAERVVVHRNGVSVDEFLARARPPDPKGPRPRVGYLGALFEWVDVALLACAARALPDLEFEIAGPVRRGVDVSALEQRPNVRLTGFRPYPLVPRTMASFDVGLIPFKEGPVARAADPIKVYEHFCFGTPVVTTPVGDLARLGELLYVASGPDAFVAAIRAALAEKRPDLRERRVEHARANDWTERSRALARTLVGL